MTEEIINIEKLKEEIERLEQENERLRERQINWYNAEAQKYKSALEEIREVIYYCGHKDVVDKVLPKINEVLK